VGIDPPDTNVDELLLEAVNAAVLVALERIGDDPSARYRFFRWLLAVAEREAVRGRLS
jgi:hypothetical protein